jgi:hypothetical protein
LTLNDPDPGDFSWPDLTQLEEQLARLRPVEPSPRLLRRLEAARAPWADRTRRVSGRWQAAALAGSALLIAMMLLARIGGRGAGPSAAPTPDEPIAKVDLGASNPGADIPRFTLLSYRRAMTRSPDEFDALLARDSAVTESPSFVLAFEHPGVGPRLAEGESHANP